MKKLLLLPVCMLLSMFSLSAQVYTTTTHPDVAATPSCASLARGT
jgi:hypothetical protein